MSQIFIGWGGDRVTSQQFDSLYLNSLSGKRILYIPRALYPERYESARERITTIFPSSQWYATTLLTSEATRDETLINQFDGLYIGGGNTFRLLSLIRWTWFDTVIKQFIDSDKPIYWGSAGAIIFGQEIHTSSDRNTVKLSFDETKGFNKFGWYSICCHYSEKHDTEIMSYVHNFGISVIALPESMGCYIDNKKIFVDWKGYVTVFTQDKKENIYPSQKIMV